MTFTLTTDKYDISVLNAIRRTLMSGIPVYSIDTIEIIKNTSILNNDILNHRISLVPSNIQSNSIKINIVCHNKSKTEDLDVYSDGIYGLVEGILLITLRPNQEINLSAETQIRYGRDDGRFSNVTNLILKQHREITSDFNLTSERVKVSPNWIDLNQIENINEINGEKSKITIKDTNKMTLSFESTTHEDEEIIFKKALDILIETLQKKELVITDYSIANMLMWKYYDNITKTQPKKILSIQKIHPLNKVFNVKRTPLNNKTFNEEISTCFDDLI